MKNSNVFYCPEISDIALLSEEESFHAIRVLRMKNGDEIHLMDGKGGLFKGKISDTNSKKCLIQIIANLSTTSYLLPAIHLAVAPTKNISRYEWFLEKAVEIGVSEITPLICERSERKNFNLERMQKILISAMKQSMNLFLPKLNEPKNFYEFAEAQNFAPLQKFIAHYSKIHLKNIYKKGNDAVILIGPEGDFSEEEIKLAKENGFIEASLGKSRLRTETAAITACHTINLICEE